MKKLLLLAPLTLLVAFCFLAVPAFASDSPSIISAGCFNSRGGDATYSLCMGYRLTHEASGVVAKLSFVGPSYAKITLTGANATYLTLYKGKPKSVLAENNGKVTFTFIGKSSNFAQLKVVSDSVAPAHSSEYSACSDTIAYGNGIYTACQGDTITFNPNGIQINVDDFGNGSLFLSFVGATVSKINIPLHTSKTINSSTWDPITLTYSDYLYDKAQITIKSKHSLLSTPQLELPSYDSSFTGSQNITYRWDPVPGAVRYSLVERNADNLSQSFYDPVTTTSTTIHHDAASKRTTYYWKISAFDSDDNTVNSPEWRFTLGPVSDVGSCVSANSAGGDGSYSACVGNTITHWPSGLVVTVVSYNTTSTRLNFSDSKGNFVNSLTVYKTGFASINFNGRDLSFKYGGSYPNTGAYITISSVLTNNNSQNPTLISPTLGGSFTGSQNIYYSWNPVPGASYYIFLEKESDQHLYYTTQSEPLYTNRYSFWHGAGSAPKQFFWRIRAYNNDGTYRESDEWSYVLKSDQQTLGTPALTSPANGSPFTGAQTIHYNWTSVPGAVRYTMMERSSNSSTTFFSQTSTTNSNSSYHNVGSSRVTYYWKVRAFSVDGAYQDSDEWYFTLGPSTSNSVSWNVFGTVRSESGVIPYATVKITG